MDKLVSIDTSLLQKPRSAKETRRAIVCAALEEFAERFVEGARTREIARKAKVNHAAINYHFGSKWEMYTKVMELVIESLSEKYQVVYDEIDAYLKSPDATKEGAKELVKKFLIFHHHLYTNPDFTNFFRIIQREESMPTRAFETVYEKGYKPMFSAFKKLVKFALKEKLSERRLDTLIFSLIVLNGALCSCRATYLRSVNKPRLDDGDVKVFGETVSLILDKIFK